MKDEYFFLNIQSAENGYVSELTYRSGDDQIQKKLVFKDPMDLMEYFNGQVTRDFATTFGIDGII